MSPPLHLAVALDGAGWHPASWREPEARPDQVLTARYWVDTIQEAERGLLDLVTIEDSLALQSTVYAEPDHRTDQVRGRLDAVLIAARVAPVTRRIGLIPSAVVTHTEPFHLSKAIATLDFVSGGRSGVRVQVSGRAHEAAQFGRRAIPLIRLEQRDRPEVATLFNHLFDEAADYVEVVRRGTAGRMTPRSGTSPPGASSTATSCTTSTSRAAGSASRDRRSPRGRRRVSRS
jgi:alkanesulfonate monooxygenase SsuD/methylene tetrahydromethanopterin reductase-like flavin-dependent oxidoreductase (luciferase family)